MSIDEMIEVLQAYKEGKKIQYKFYGEWIDFSGTPSFDFHHFEYRIKPEKKPDVVEVMFIYCNFRKDLLELTYDGETNVLKSVRIVK